MVFLLNSPIMDYDWGDASLFEKYFAIQKDGVMAELWMGAHTKASSVIHLKTKMSLLDAIEKDPDYFLGPSVQKQFGSKLPFLFKVLSAKKALSIQAHPSLKQAQKGFEQEEKSGIAIDGPSRNYKDDNHKPELICAVSDFWALRGFREISRIVEDLKALNLKICDTFAEKLAKTKDLKAFFKDLFSLDKKGKDTMIRAAVDLANSQLYLDLAYDAEGAGSSKRYWWVKELSRQFPGDLGILAPLYLRTIYLQPGQAMFLPAGELHAYLKGIGVELMANSDNVLRGGCTSKHVDVPELLKVLDFKVAKFEVQDLKENEAYASSVKEFKLTPLSSFTLRERVLKGPGILLVQDGDLWLDSQSNLQSALFSNNSKSEIRGMHLKKGQSVFIPHASEAKIDTERSRSFLAFLAEVNL